MPILCNSIPPPPCFFFSARNDSFSNFTFLSMPALLPGMSSLNIAAKPQSSFKSLLKTHSSCDIKCKQWPKNKSADGILGLRTRNSLSLSLHPHESSYLKLGWWVCYHSSAIPIFGRGRSAGLMETITILNPQNSHEVALGSWEKFPLVPFLPLQVSSLHWDQNPFPCLPKGSYETENVRFIRTVLQRNATK